MVQGERDGNQCLFRSRFCIVRTIRLKNKVIAMTARTLPRFFSTVLAAALLLVTAIPTLAQPAAPTDADVLLATMEDALANPARRAVLTPAEWDAYGESLETILRNGQDGLQQSALGLVILYGPALEIGRAGVFEITRIYRNHADDRMRRMAVVALGRTQDAWALDFLKRSARFEDTPAVRHTIQAVIANAEATVLGPALSGGF